MALPLKALTTTNDRKEVDPRAVNSLRHGAYARGHLLPDEDREERAKLCDEYVRYFQPASGPEKQCVTELADLAWRRRRLERAESLLVEGALAGAFKDYPKPVRKLASEIRDMELEVAIVRRFLNRIRAELRGDGRCAASVVTGLAPLLDRLLGWETSVADEDAGTLAGDLKRILKARTRAVDASRKALNALVERHRTCIDAVKAEAALLEPELQERLRKQRVSLERSSQRLMEMIRKMRSVEFEGEFLVAKGRISKFSKTNGDEVIPDLGIPDTIEQLEDLS